MFRFRRGANPAPSRNQPQHADRDDLDARPGADPGGDRDPVDPPARATNIIAAAGRPDGQGDRQPMVLDLRISRQWRLRVVSNMLKEGRPDARRSARAPSRRPAAARRRRAHGGAGRQVVKLIVTSDRRDPQLRRARLLDQDGRGPRPDQRDLVQGRPARRLLRPVLRTVRRAPRLHADRGRGRSRGAVRAWVASKGGTCPRAPARAGDRRHAGRRRGRRRRPAAARRKPQRRRAARANQAATARIKQRRRDDHEHHRRRTRISKAHDGASTRITTPITSRASSPAGSCRPTTRTSARSI